MKTRYVVSVNVLASGLAAGWLALASVALGQAPEASDKGPKIKILPVTAQENWNAPRTAWDDPDFSGLWSTVGGVPFERPDEFGTREFLTEQEALERAARRGLGVGGDGEGLAEKLEEQDEERFARADSTDDDTPGRRIYTAEYNAFWNSEDGIGNVRHISLRTSALVDPPDGKIPSFTRELLTRWAAREEARKDRGDADGPEDREISARCIIRSGMPTGEMERGTKEIFQTPGYIAFVTQYEVVRIVPLDRRPHSDPSIRRWYGDSRGRWEGDTLVIETTNFTPLQDGGWIPPSFGRFWGRPESMGRNYPGTGENLQMVERLTRLDADTIEYRYTVDDPDVFVRPFTLVSAWATDQSSAQDRIYEYSCHEHNYGMVNTLEGARISPEAAMDEARRDRAYRAVQLEEAWEKFEKWEAAHGKGR